MKLIKILKDKINKQYLLQNNIKAHEIKEKYPLKYLPSG